METTYYSLASKNSFNKALRHFFSVNDVVDDIERRKNIADVINGELDNEEIVQDQILPIIGAVLRDKYAYTCKSVNLPVSVSDFEKIAAETSKWTAVDICVVYFAPDGKVFVINPKNAAHWNSARELAKDQLIVIYSKYRKGDDKKDKKIETDVIVAVEEMLLGKDVFINKDFIDQSVAAPAPPSPAAQPKSATAQAASQSPGKITPKYAVNVTNELFHNGNVEAWKKIIESYNTKYPGLQVHIFHKGEVINDINSLFKWGKVKHGDSIFFQVSGEEIKGVSKLQKYLSEGASQRFEQFLKVGVGKVLNLF
ncbi:MAG: hypothetical protein FWG13_02530 [Leptospirales bacterium]|nr:hypothetical protein [Leptospirales bacterium]